MDDILLHKFASLERCITRVKEEYQACSGDLENDILRQDSVVLNLERACEQVFDMGQRVIRTKKLGLAKEYRDIFLTLESNEIISKELSNNLQKMVGFRNIATHNYTELNMIILKRVVEERVIDLLEFGKMMIALK